MNSLTSFSGIHNEKVVNTLFLPYQISGNSYYLKFCVGHYLNNPISAAPRECDTGATMAVVVNQEPAGRDPLTFSTHCRACGAQPAVDAQDIFGSNSRKVWSQPCTTV